MAIVQTPTTNIIIPPPFFTWVQSVQITGPNLTATNTTSGGNRIPAGADILVKVVEVSVRIGSKTVFESDSARDQLTVAMKNGDTELQSSAFDIWLFRRMNDTATWPGFLLKGDSDLTISVTHKALSGGTAFGTVNSSTPIDIQFNFGGYRIQTV